MQRDYRRAANVRADLLTLLEGLARSGTVVTVRVQLAESLHAAGRCGEAARHADRA
jgi:hypothetical protein